MKEKNPAAGAKTASQNGLAAAMSFFTLWIGALRNLGSPLVWALARSRIGRTPFATLAAVVGVALGTATVGSILVLDANTQRVEAGNPVTDPSAPFRSHKVVIRKHSRLALGKGKRAHGGSSNGKNAESAREETHEDYEVMRSAVRVGSLAAFLVGALTVFFAFSLTLSQRKQEQATLGSLGMRRSEQAASYLLEALLVTLGGSLAGGVLVVPMSAFGALMGITTTGRARIDLREMTIPWLEVGAVVALGGAVGLLGLLGPASRALRQPTSAHSSLGHSEQSEPGKQKPTGGGLGLGLPLLAGLSAMLFYVLRPFLKDALPSLTFFVVEGGLTLAGFALTLGLIPNLLSLLARAMAPLVRRSGSAVTTLTQRRLSYEADELAFATTGVMVVVALLFALHTAVYALRNEVSTWGKQAAAGVGYVTTRGWEINGDAVLPRLPKACHVIRLSGQTAWPYALRLAQKQDLLDWAKRSAPEFVPTLRNFKPQDALLSSMMARRYHLHVGDEFYVETPQGEAKQRVALISDKIGYAPKVGPYRHSKTYAILLASRAKVVGEYLRPLGTTLVLWPKPGQTENACFGPTEEIFWGLHRKHRRFRPLRFQTGREFVWRRRLETSRDFLIFDGILLLTSLLSAIGVANQLFLSVFARRRQFALLRVLGMTDGQLRKLMLWEGAFVGAVGGAMGIFVGGLLGLSAIGALKAVSAFALEVAVPWHYVPPLLIASTLLGLFAASLPARWLAQERVHRQW